MGTFESTKPLYGAYNRFIANRGNYLDDMDVVMKRGPKSKKTEEELDELGVRFEGWKRKQLERITERFLKLLRREARED